MCDVTMCYTQSAENLTANLQDKMMSTIDINNAFSCKAIEEKDQKYLACTWNNRKTAQASSQSCTEPLGESAGLLLHRAVSAQLTN